jgi:hypothetical protein
MFFEVLFSYSIEERRMGRCLGGYVGRAYSIFIQSGATGIPYKH